MPATPATPHWFSEPADLVAAVRRDGTIAFVGPSVLPLLGFRPKELIGRPWEEFVAPRDLEPTREFVAAVAQRRAEQRGFVNRCRSRDGDDVWLEWTAQVIGDLVYVAARDITRERETAQRLARSEQLWRACFARAPIGMCLATEDGRFVDVNEAFAEFLAFEADRLVGSRVNGILPPEERPIAREDLASLFGGHVERYRRERRFVRADGAIVWGEAAVSTVTTPDGERCVLAQVVDITDRKREQERMAEEFSAIASLQRLRDALDEHRLLVFAQPIVELRSGRVAREELLVRMEDEDGRVLAPGEFLPAAERFGLIREVDRWVLRRAATIASPDRPVAVNVSARSLEDDALLQDLRDVIAGGLAPEAIVFEITETALADDTGAVVRFAEAVRELGCALAIDDFGVGYSGLMSLKQLGPLAATLKIDRAFVTNVVGDAEARRIVEAAVGLAAGFGQTTVAEGVEDQATVACLLDAGVTHGQGYLFGRPRAVVTGG